MTTSLRFVGLTSAFLLWWAAVAGAQTSSTSTTNQPPQTSTSSDSDSSTRPATTTFFGDTGLWYVPTAEVLASGKVSVSGYRRGPNRIQGRSHDPSFCGR